ncbi:serine/threonine-protein phosphatase 6 regulatory ankyrin repeat subunit B-like [Haliotis rubra]|uniref:serine/threonine-protein phosphatase 6 regulatory ankyrin repeat subunit B-like n=1 Tax=Haliotis rubra TaxID=36100 RepID=UPI001EE512C7|nr:serine/threonine-protein phosphatase 6 regulatory ankyrin repeat subunit B-like [Haliotis rubra]
MKQNYPEICPQLKADKKETLHDACRKGDLGLVRSILSRGLVDVNSRDDKYRMTPLMVAAHEGHRRLFAFLVRTGANVSHVDENGDNVLHLARRGGRMRFVKYVVTQYSVDINSKGMYGSTPLLQAVYCGHRDLLKFLVTKGANLSHVDDDGGNILHWACRGGHVGVVKEILTQYNIDVNSRENHGETSLMKAASKGHLGVFLFLVSKGANVSNVDEKGDNILHHASIGGHAKMVQHILSQNLVDINSRGKYGRTPLMRAAYYGHRKVFELLVSRGGLTQLLDDGGENILHQAALGGQVEMAKHILSADMVDINSRGKTGETPLMRAAFMGYKVVFLFLVNMGANVSYVDDDGDNILHHASIGGHAKMVQHILSQNLVDINSRGKYGRTPLMRAAYYGHRKVFELLVSRGGLTQLVDDNGENILHQAALGGQVEMAKHILSEDMVDINSRGKTGETPLMRAAFMGYKVVFQFLGNMGANVSYVDDDGDNILHHAADGGHANMVRHILSQNLVDIDSRGKYGSTPLFRAAYYGHRKVLDLLVSRGCLTQLVDDNGENILHQAALGGQVEMAKHILSEDMVDINSRGKTGETPLMRAAFMGYKVVFQFLGNMGANVSYVDDDGDNILHHAADGGHANMVRHILSQNLVDIDSRGKYGSTPLFRAAYYGHRKVFDLLVSRGCLTHLVDDLGRNILHVASSRGNVMMVKHILSMNIADINARDKGGKTAAMIAKCNGKLRLYNYLFRKVVK